jgi:hypothetical protein
MVVILHAKWLKMVATPPKNLLFIVLALGCLAACSDNGGEATNNGEPDTTVEADTDANDDPEPTWIYSTIGSGDVGLYPELAVSETGEVGVAFFATSPVEGDTCSEVMSDDPPNKMFWALRFASATGQALEDGSWQTETVADILSLAEPRGLDFAYAPDGTAMVATMTGEPVVQPSYCGANDVGLFRRNGADDWSLDTAVSTSDEAATGEPASDFGDVVGYWPALAFDGAGEAVIAYKDVHAGGLQGDDRKRADLELARQGGGWSSSPVDVGRGAGDYNTVAVDAQNRPILAHYNPVETASGPQLGVWVARPSSSDDSFDTVQLFNQATADGPTLVIHPDDDLPRVLFYNSSEGYPEIAVQIDEAQFSSISSGWELSDIGDARYDEGYDASLALNPDGQMAAVYYRCAEVASGLGNCTPADDALVFAWEDAGDWTHEIVDAGGDGLCGRRPSLGFDDSGFAHMAYECETLVDGELETQIKYARRKPL